MARNPHSHEGTEWLHQRILEAKMALSQDPAWLQSHSVAGYDFGTENYPVWPKDLGADADRERLGKALEYQLGERLAFVSPPDAIVADLLVTLGNLRALDTSVERGRLILNLALKFKPANPELINRRSAYFAEVERYGLWIYWAKVAFGCLVVFIPAVALVRWYQRV